MRQIYTQMTPEAETNKNILTLSYTRNGSLRQQSSCKYDHILGFQVIGREIVERVRNPVCKEREAQREPSLVTGRHPGG